MQTHSFKSQIQLQKTLRHFVDELAYTIWNIMYLKSNK